MLVIFYLFFFANWSHEWVKAIDQLVLQSISCVARACKLKDPMKRQLRVLSSQDERSGF